MAARMSRQPERKVPAPLKWGAGSLFGCLAVGAVVLLLPGRPQAAPPGHLRERVLLAGVPMGGKAEAEAEAMVRELAARLVSYPLAVRYNRRIERVTAAKLGGTVDVDAILAELKAPAPEAGSLVERIRTRFSGPRPHNVPVAVQLPPDGVEKGLMRFSIRIGAEPRNPRFTKVKGEFKIIPPKPGREIDPDAVAAAIRAALDAPEFRARLLDSLDSTERSAWLKTQEPLEIRAVTRDARSRITVEHLAPITATLARFSTPLGASSRSRVHNISIACRAIDGVVLLPEDTFSYNAVVGPRIPSAGYRNAPVIIAGELSQGIAGGICQVSSTLYNAVLFSDLKIVTRRHHAMPVHYVPAGRDATVVDGAIDFRFKNSLPHPIAVGVRVAGGRVVCEVYGHPEDRREVSIETTGASRIAATSRTIPDPKLPRGKKVVEKSPRSGRRVSVYRVVKEDGTVIRKELLSRDTYPAAAGVIREGTAAPAPKETAKPAPGGPSPANETPEEAE